ncbi:MAG: alpha/beta hydrolase [Crocinitomicaceae bacterium]|nr:alpha/beta hydrolase [Crocinitomicaceae bacterium]
MKTPIIALLLTLLVSGAANALNPSRTHKQLPDKYNMKYEAKKVKTNDGEAELNTWYFAAKKKTTSLVLIAHNSEGNMADYLRRVDQLLISHNVVIFDYRGYGESSEFEIDNDMYIYPHFQDDLETMIDHCRKDHVQTYNLYGWGIGGGLSIGIGYGRTDIKKIIADTPFLSMEDLEERFESWDDPMEVPFAGYDKANEALTAVTDAPGKNLTGVKLIVGSNDIMFTTEDYKKLQKSSEKMIDKDIYVVENPDRKDNYKVNQEAYAKVMLEFLESK